jgi:Phage integrase, N-terminal SAM-like domain
LAGRAFDEVDSDHDGTLSSDEISMLDTVRVFRRRMTDKAMSPLRRRMIEYMTIRKFAPKTQASYIRAVRNFTLFLGRSPDQASAEDRG